jgi:hypothetical protein
LVKNNAEFLKVPYQSFLLLFPPFHAFLLFSSNSASVACRMLFLAHSNRDLRFCNNYFYMEIRRVLEQRTDADRAQTTTIQDFSNVNAMFILD